MSKLGESVKKGIKQGIQVGTENFGIPVIDLLIKTSPEWLPAWLIVRGFFGVFFSLQQEKINEFVQFIRDNPEAFTKKILATKEFQEGFLITFEQYLKQRGEKKRKIIQRIFLGFTITKDKENFELERMYTALNSLSLEGIQYLKFIKEEIFPAFILKLQESVKNRLNGGIELHKNKDEKYWEIFCKRTEDIGVFFRKYFQKNPEEILQHIYDQRRNELIIIGILRNHDNFHVYISDFGYQFLDFIDV
jgi:hypothetical protein